MTYPEVVKALEKEFGTSVHHLEVEGDEGICYYCGDEAVAPILSFSRGAGPAYHFCCADRPACRERAARQRDERERAVVDAVKL